MRLSDAMLKGCEKHPHRHGHFFTRMPGTDEILSSCALGAAMVGLLGDPVDTVDGVIALKETFPQLDAVLLRACPAGCAWPDDVPNFGSGGASLFRTIAHLSDTHWTREAIAAWVAQYDEVAA
jgi:hypothetical protein